jgi:ArsR family transcriptional regulator, arsenate/arsenite/antimonite-responsive transcriptional repressor
MKDFLAITKALSDENRLRAMMALAGGELCVCQIIELLGLAPSTVSKHMAVLHQAGLVETRKAGRWVYYRLADGAASPCAALAVAWLGQCLGRDPRVRDDARQLKCIRKMTREELCAHYGSCRGESVTP